MIAPEQRELAQRLFEGALQRTSDQRRSYLEDACPSDPRLREDVLRMVAYHEADTEFLEEPVVVQLLTGPVLEKGDLVNGRYRIVRQLGAGGMGEVYEAVDIAHPQHPERVALKTIRRDLAAIPNSSGRLHREIQLAHKVAHPNVCKIHHLDWDPRPEGNLLFLTMDLLEGETLWKRIHREGPLAAPAVLDIASQIAHGLDGAHREGVIHRDLKSANIMLVPRPDGTTRAVIMDFGLAAGEEEQGVTGSGTVAYMAPERLEGSPAGRSADLYSFGVILYEMVTGDLPFPTGTPLESRRTLPKAPSAFRRGAPRRWDRVILKCLDPKPENRYQQACAAADDLRFSPWPLVVAAVLVFALLSIPKVVPQLISMLTRPEAVAILPFETAGGSAPPTGLVDYIADELQRSPSIRRRWLIFSPSDARRARVTTGAQARAALGASYYMAGTLSAGDQSLTLTARLFRAGGSRPSASFQKTCRLDSVVCLQDGMVRAMGGLLVPQAFVPSPSPPISKEALPYYLQGLEYLRRDSLSYTQAIPWIEKAIALQPGAPQPRIALADAYLFRYRASTDKADLNLAGKILDEVMAVHAGMPEVRSSRGVVLRLQGQYEQAERELRIALQADPSNHTHHLRLAAVESAMGNEASAIAEFRKAIELQPRYWANYVDFGYFQYSHGRFGEAADLIEQLVAFAPNHAQGLAMLGGIYVDMRRNTDAERVSRRSCEIRPDRTCYVNLGVALERQWNYPEALKAYDRALASGPLSTMAYLNIANLHASLGEASQAHEFYLKAIEIAQQTLKANVQDSGTRAILAYCKAQAGDREGAQFEIGQALPSLSGVKNVQKYGVLTFESLGMRDQALETLRGVTPSVLADLETAQGTASLRQDPRYPQIAQEIRNRKE
ncbi:MAG TPA: protein kinase [Candidatus Acidoferrales bacterium]|nr:protein kinase [Candidatus Acidoferrales bacterium]